MLVVKLKNGKLYGMYPRVKLAISQLRQLIHRALICWYSNLQEQMHFKQLKHDLLLSLVILYTYTELPDHQIDAVYLG